MKSVLKLCVVLFVAVSSLAQTATTTTAKKKTTRTATVTANDVQELKDALAAQQQQIQQLNNCSRRKPQLRQLKPKRIKLPQTPPNSSKPYLL